MAITIMTRTGVGEGVPMRAGNRRAFTLVELLTVMAIIGLLISILMPPLSRAREMARRSLCLANLRAIGQGCLTYAASSHGHFPCVNQTQAGFNAIGDAWDWDGTATTTFAGNPAPAGYSPVSNTRNLWLLIKIKTADTKTFMCPSDPEAGDAFTPAVIKGQVNGSSDIADVQNRSQFSYAFQYQGPAFADDGVTLRQGWNTTVKDDPRLVILADTSPAFRPMNSGAIGTSSMAQPDDHTFELASATSTTFPEGVKYIDVLNYLKNTAGTLKWNAQTARATYTLQNTDDTQYINSRNHRGEGQNIVRLDGSGDFAADPWGGAYMDNIWTVQDYAPYADSTSTDDQILTARMLGRYEDTQADLMKQWVKRPESKDRYPDSFLVP